jgi:hypothetical protein
MAFLPGFAAGFVSGNSFINGSFAKSGLSCGDGGWTFSTSPTLRKWEHVPTISGAFFLDLLDAFYGQITSFLVGEMASIEVRRENVIESGFASIECLEVYNLEFDSNLLGDQCPVATIQNFPLKEHDRFPDFDVFNNVVVEILILFCTLGENRKEVRQRMHSYLPIATGAV